MIRYPLSGLLLFWLVLSSCGPGTENSGKPVVSVSILPQRYFIDRIAGDLVDVNVMIPPGASPATYEPTVSQLSKLSRSPLYMRIGYVGFELSWMDKISSVNPEMKIVDLSQGIELLSEGDAGEPANGEHTHEGTDPHVWMSLVNAKIIAQNVFDEIVILFPGERETMRLQLERLLWEIDSLHLHISDMLASYPSKGFMIYHPALTYFARDYNLKQYSLELGGKTPSPAHLRWMIDLGREQQISVIFLQRQFEQRNAEVLAGEIGAKIIMIDPLDPDWFTQIGYIADQLNAAF
jgi:zinc transport system substrate-binding protein